MTDFATIAVIFCYLLFFGAIFTILLYLILKRIGTKGKEGFEERDN